MKKKRLFIAIGPPKTGTTWLYKVLTHHPEVWLPPHKEIRYFWTKEFLRTKTALGNLFGSHWHYQDQRSTFYPFLSESLRAILRNRFNEYSLLKWNLKFFFGFRTDGWYLNLFPDNILSGDITPKYCELSDATIRDIRKLLPDCKVIISLRDPIDRSWSRVKMNLLRKRKLKSIQEIDSSEILSHISDPHQLASNDYTELIARWTKIFGKDQLFIFHFEELNRAPFETYKNICHFLSIGPSLVDQTLFTESPYKETPIPSSILEEMVRMNWNFIEKYARHHPNEFSQQWYQKYFNMAHSLGIA